VAGDPAGGAARAHRHGRCDQGGLMRAATFAILSLTGLVEMAFGVLSIR
jgi:hypothetical protein